MPQCDETRFSTIQPSIDMTGIRNETWRWRKNDAVIWVALVACTKFGVNKQKQTCYWAETEFHFLESDLDLNHRHLGSNPKLPLDISYPYSKFVVNRPKQTNVIEQKLNFYFSNIDLDLDHIHLGSNPKLCLDVSYPYSKFGVNRPKQTKVMKQKLNFYF